jgi:hypothetical protein
MKFYQQGMLTLRNKTLILVFGLVPALLVKAEIRSVKPRFYQNSGFSGNTVNVNKR